MSRKFKNINILPRKQNHKKHRTMNTRYKKPRWSETRNFISINLETSYQSIEDRQNKIKK